MSKHAFALAVSLLLVSSAASAEAERPNIIVILADDLGWGDLACYGATDMRTPHLDALAGAGRRFDHFYANCCVCSPTRAALLTGRYQDVVGVPGVIRTNPADNWGYLAPDATLLPELLKSAGYHTAIVGKWHLGLESPNTPLERGFDHFHGFLGDMMDDYYTHLRHEQNYMRLGEETISPEGHATDLLTEWAIDYVRARVEVAKAGKQPFFLYLAYNAPHTPIQPPDDWLARVRQRERNIDPERAKLVALIEHMDDGIGRLMAALEEAGLRENTLVVFSSDNGGQLNVGANNGAWRGGKQDMYEGGLLVPTFAAWPGHIEPGSRSNTIGITMDLFPTLCAVAGIEPPSEIDGTSLLSAMLQGDELPPRELYFTRREGNIVYMGKTSSALRRGDWKLLQNLPTEPFELYHLRDDPYEQQNLAAKNKAKFNELAAALRLHIQRGGAVPWQPPATDDAYERYLRTSQDFRRVRQDKDWALQAFPSWTFMPWTYQWTIGYDEPAGQWSLAHGYNGAFIDRDAIAAAGSRTGKLDWINRFGLRFYVDHVADKGLLHLWDGDKVKPHLDELHGVGVRTVPLNEQTRSTLQSHMREHIAASQSSPHRAAYALDDEPSWGHFVHPTMWQVTDDATAYPRWLSEVYGDVPPGRERWISYEELRPQLASWSVAEFDASPLMDQWSFNDSHWANLMGDLVEYSNSLDPATPCGLVGGQMPSPFGGYDYAKLMRKVQFIESYNLGSSQAIIRSFNPRGALPSVTTLFHKSADDTIWQTWYYLAHGNRGHIGWVQDWFDGSTPKAWHAEVAPAFLEAGQKIGPLMRGAEWHHDGVAIYYSHPSIQLGWILDAEAHGKTWINRNADDRISSAAHVRRAWENMLRDEGVQYNFLSYVDVVERGVPSEYRVLILPACLCLSDAEARQIRAFCQRGGTVLADYLPGVWDQHGRGRQQGGALDDLFGVAHDPRLRAADIFGERLWVEVDQDANFYWKSYEEFLTNKNTCLRQDNGFHRAVREMPIETVRSAGRGHAVLMNLSPQWYNAYRVAGAEAASKREPFLRHIATAGVAPWVRLEGDANALHGYEITYWSLPSAEDGSQRRVLFVCLNPETRGTSTGGGNSVGLKTERVPVTLHFTHDARNVYDERREQSLGDGSRFALDWKQNEALVLSFDAP